MLKLWQFGDTCSSAILPGSGLKLQRKQTVGNFATLPGLYAVWQLCLGSELGSLAALKLWQVGRGCSFSLGSLAVL